MKSWKAIAALGLFFSATAFADTKYYLMRDVAEQATDAQWRAYATALQEIHDVLVERSGVDAELYYSSDLDVNAFATEVENRKKIVVVQEGLIEMLKDDREAIAAVLGHELAHHKGDHIRKGRKKQEGMRAFGAILGAIVGAKVGDSKGYAAGALAGAAVGVGAELIAMKFSRDQELEADRLSMQWLSATDYDPSAMLRLQKRLATLEGKSKRKNGIMSTHPRSEKRYKAAEKVLAGLHAEPSWDRDAIQPLVGDGELLAMRKTVEKEQERKLAEVLVPMKAPPAALVAPLDTVSFKRYAAVSNEIFKAGESKQDAILAKHKISRQAWDGAERAFETRKRKDDNAISHYNVLFFRATTGEMAPYGKELADSYEKGLPLKLEPPCSLETAIAMVEALDEYRGEQVTGEIRAAVEESLSAFNMDYYKYTIAVHWWKRKASIAAMAGDSSLLAAFMGSQAHARERG